MRRSLARLRGAGFILWHARHEFYHLLLGALWAWILREWWGAFNPKWVATALVGSVLPDIDHLLYFFGHGRYTAYTKQIKDFLRKKQWRAVMVFIANGHKYNTNLSYHNIYMVGILFIFSLLSSLVDWEVGVILFGSMVLHYLFDIADDLVQLGSLNPNWKRWGKER